MAKEQTVSKIIALKDFHVFCPPLHDIQIKKGDDLSVLNLPKSILLNLVTEKILKG